jgi:uncharacterized protein (DUF433 family)
MPPILNAPVAIYFADRGKVTAKGVAGHNDTVQVFLSPIIPKGMTDDQIYANFAQIEALDKKEVKNAGQFSIDLNPGTTEPPFTVIIATSAGKVARPRVQPAPLAEVLLGTEADYQLASGLIKVTGVAGPTETVRALLNPDLTGILDSQIFERYPTIAAEDKKEKTNAGSFTLFLDPHGKPGPYRVVVVTNVGNVERPDVQHVPVEGPG